MKNFLHTLTMSLLAGCAGGSDLPGVLAVDPAEASLGEVPVDSSATATFTIANGGEADLEVYSTTFVDGDPDVWRLETDGGPVLAGGASMTLTVTFAPEDEEAVLARVQVRSSDEATGPVLVTITATGTPSTLDDDEDGFSPAQGDCNDARDDVFPGATELCDGRDNDCDAVTPAGEADHDGDGQRICAGDCDDDDDDVYLDAPEICDQKDSDCSGGGNQDDADVDGDGLSICEDDCDDGEALAYPGNPEVCGDAIDNDCSGDVDDIDVDLDGHSPCHPAGDCDDLDEDAHPVIVDASAAAGGDGTDGAPFRGFTGAFGALDATCRTIWVAEGAYETSRSLASGAVVTIVGEEGAEVVIAPPEASGSRTFTVAAGASLTLRGVTLADADVSGDGGALWVSGGVAVLDDVVVRDNACGGDGAGVAVEGGGALTVQGGLFDGNVSGDDGGAIALASGAVTIDGTRFVANEGVRGGAVYAIGGALDVDGATFDGNLATQDGGALYLEGGTVAVDVLRSVFWRNDAGGVGGALAATDVDDATGDVRNNRFQNNVAGGDGGAVALTGLVAGLVLANNTFAVNTAGDEGAHVSIDATDASGVQCVANVGGWGNAGVGKAGFFVALASGAVATHNLAFFTSGTDFGGAIAVDTDGNLSQNPEFTAFTDDANPANDDPRLLGTSPGVDSGPADAGWNDLDESRNDRGFEGGPHAAP